MTVNKDPMPRFDLSDFSWRYFSVLLPLFLCMGCLPVHLSKQAATAGETINIQNINTQNNQTQRPIVPLIKTSCRQAVFQPAVFKNTQRRIRLSPRLPQYQNIPAEMRWHTERIQIEPARYETETVPAVYREVTQEIVIRPERIELVAEPGRTADLTRQIPLKPAYTRWKPGCLAEEDKGGLQQCLQAMPERLQTLVEKIPDIPARVKQVLIPGETLKVTRKVLVTPGQGSGKIRPARYMTIRKAHVQKTWEIKTSGYHPARYKTLDVQQLLRTSRIIKRPSVCQGQLTTQQILALQQVLKTQGYLTQVTLSGKMDKQTSLAILRFQQDKQLSTGALTRETLRALALL